MFIPAKGSAPFLHPSRVSRKQNHWSVVTRALEAPWYLLVYDVTCQWGHKVSQTSLVACDEALVDMLAEMAAADVHGLACLDRRHGPGPCWGLHWIDAVWKPAPEEARTVGRLLIRWCAMRFCGRWGRWRDGGCCMSGRPAGESLECADGCLSQS